MFAIKASCGGRLDWDLTTRNMLGKVKKNKKFLSALKILKTDISKWKEIGRGSYGIAYDMGDGRVCKLTRNKPETNAALKLKRSNKKYSYLYKILNVFVINKQNAHFDYGLIITPKYKKLTDRQKAELYELFCFLDLRPSFKLQSMKQIKRKIQKAVKDYYSDRRAWAIIDTVTNERLKTFKKYNILYMLRNLKSAHLGPEDIHYDNILKNNQNKFILIDVAC